MTAFSITPATISDAHTLSLVGGATFLESFAETLPGENIVDHCHRQHSVKVYAQYLRGGAAAWLARLDATGATVGYALNAPPDLPIDTGPNDLELKRIYLLSRYQGLGIGKALMDAAIGDARARGCGRLLLGVYEGNTKAIDFYKSAGFTVVGTRKFQVGDGTFDDLILARPL